ncbi:MAG: CARDB domain-containing protein [Pseudomonadota bacterium]
MKPDLLTYIMDSTVSASASGNDLTIDFQYVVSNSGAAQATNIDVDAVMTDEGGNTETVDLNTVQLLNALLGVVPTTSITLSYSPGTSFLYLVVDGDNNIDEFKEDNNESLKLKIQHSVADFGDEKFYDFNIFAYQYDWFIGDFVGWYYGWGNSWHVSWYLGWGYGWNFGWYNAGAGWLVGWNVGWNVGWHFGWNTNGHLGWQFGQTYGLYLGWGWQLVAEAESTEFGPF